MLLQTKHISNELKSLFCFSCVMKRLSELKVEDKTQTGSGARVLVNLFSAITISILFYTDNSIRQHVVDCRENIYPAKCETTLYVLR